MVVYEIADIGRQEFYHSKESIVLRGNKGLILSYLHDEDKDLHVVEVERYYEQLEVNIESETAQEALDFMFAYKNDLPKLDQYKEKIVNAKYGVMLNLMDDLTEYTLSDTGDLTKRTLLDGEEYTTAHQEQDKLLFMGLGEKLQKTLEGKTLIFPDYSALEVRIQAQMTTDNEEV